MNSFSDWHKLKKAVAWVLRLKSVLRRRAVERKAAEANVDVGAGSVSRCTRSRVKARTSDQTSGCTRLTVKEIYLAELAVIRWLQNRSFPEEIACTVVKKSSPLCRLSPVIDDDILRVGGRLQNSKMTEAAKHPMLIPKTGHITNLIVRDIHEREGHSGREHTLASLREKYWIIQGNAAVRRVLARCVWCRRRQAPVVTQKMADLPPERTTPSDPPFTRVGVDYFGPFVTKCGRKQMKRYGVLFTCLTTRAIHVEIADSLDTSSFINALCRFQARRGQARYIRSDNGTNFVGAERELREAIQRLNQDRIHDCLLQKGIDWVFNAPGASHHGGTWERQIRTVRKVLNSLLTEQTLTDEALRTLTCEVEAIVNSRPITTTSSDPTDLEPLTPNHLLLLRGVSAPLGTFSQEDGYSRKRWRQVQYLADVFWRRWMREYLPSLQIRQRWTREDRNLSVGDVVLVVDNAQPRCQWLLGRVKETFPDKQGYVRTVTVKTAHSVLRRPITKLVLLQETDE